LLLEVSLIQESYPLLTKRSWLGETLISAHGVERKAVSDPATLMIA